MELPSDEEYAERIGHGWHWDILAGDSEGSLQHLMPVAISEGEITARSVFHLPGEPNTDCALIEYQDGHCRIAAILTSDPQRDGMALHTSFPFCAASVDHEVTIVEIHQWEGTAEAELVVELGDGHMMNVFALDFAVQAGRYVEGARLRLSLGGLGFMAEAASDEPVMLDDPDQIRIYHELNGDEGSSDPVEVSQAGLSYLVPTPGGQRAESEFRGPVLKASPARSFDLPFTLAEIQVQDFESVKLTLPVLFSSVALGDYELQPGQEVHGVAWVHGRIAGNPEPMAAPAPEAPARKGFLGRLRDRFT